MTLVDTNVVIDVVAKNPTWLRWSAEQLDRAGAVEPVVDQRDYDP
jgi:predicted nucleic acid-binding protein